MKLIVSNIEGVTAPDYRMTVKGSALCPEAGLNLGDAAYPLPSGDTASRDKDAPIGSVRYNTETNQLEVKTSPTAWGATQITT
jgi:hypothetical protein